MLYVNVFDDVCVLSTVTRAFSSGKYLEKVIALVLMNFYSVTYCADDLFKGKHFITNL